MPTAYVYSPFTGIIFQGPGCNDNHTPCGQGSSPVDVGGSGTVRLYVNYPTVSYVHVEVGTLCCNNVPGANDDQRRTVKLNLYDVNNCFFGSVLYGHIRSLQVTHGQWIPLTSVVLNLGLTVNELHSTCYKGIHIHMQRLLGATHTSCGANANQGTTLIYSWTIGAC